MDYDHLLENFNGGGGREQVALAIFYFEEFTDTKSVTQSDIKEVIGNSRSSFSTSGVSSYIHRLQDSKWITSKGDAGYQLTHKGKDSIEDLLQDGFLDKPREDRFIDTNDLDENRYYERLVSDINKCYQHRIPDAALVLSRKLFEHLVYNILQGHYGGSKNEMFLDTDRNRPLGFKSLVKNLRDEIPTLRQYSRDLDDDVVNTIDSLREEGNEGAHSIRVDITEEELEGLSHQVTRASEILFDIYAKIQLREN